MIATLGPVMKVVEMRETRSQVCSQRVCSSVLQSTTLRDAKACAPHGVVCVAHGSS